MRNQRAKAGPASGIQPVRSLVTGGAGFLGSHLCDRLLDAGHEVSCVDNLLTGRRENIRHLLQNPCFRFIQHDVTEALDGVRLASVKASSDGKRRRDPDPLSYVFHLASPASPGDYARLPVQTLKVGAWGTFHALEIARASGAVFLLASTSEVYGDPEVSPQPETYWGRVNPVGPRSVYDEAKRFAEALTMTYHREYGLPVRIARIFNTYGPGMRPGDGRVLPNFIMQALQEKPLTIYGDGSQTRSFCYVSDLVEGLCRLAFSSEVGPVNLGSPEEMRILDLARLVIEVTSSRSQLKFEPLPIDDPRRRCPDISKAVAELEWRPIVTLNEGIRRTIAYFKDRSEAPCLR